MRGCADPWLCFRGADRCPAAGLNDKVLLEATGRRNALSRGRAVELEDIKFHQVGMRVAGSWAGAACVVRVFAHVAVYCSACAWPGLSMIAPFPSSHPMASST